ncbi:hypothetical protein [Flavobacterium lindanitolerans]|uniref:hypothetical protein n=1 Tax=Flavobacterium lindanitolerans TaxID=428988 RepID=UPI0031DB84ED
MKDQTEKSIGALWMKIWKKWLFIKDYTMLADNENANGCIRTKNVYKSKIAEELDNHHKKSHSFQNGFYISGKTD